MLVKTNRYWVSMYNTVPFALEHTLIQEKRIVQ